ncbi:DUF4401 domain-containing protein [Thalassotalea marina]|uniref:DUF4401 domain-containing protein n=1 Tax=Thalassotalea marina TaxID=1673741 RepID=A0A919EK96_9GAMM|nr:DUF4401 domain-containing protein [Thalassotalea marina]GHF89634.1 hypothetical protein GCM10017161_16870 [Thalassotalea marina]
MSASHHTLWQQLKAQHLVQGEAPILEATSPWFVKSMLAFVGWLGALFIMLFVFSAFPSLIDNPKICFILSVPLFLLSYFILTKPNNDFFEHVALAISFAAQGLVLFALYEWLSNSTFLILFAILQGVLVLLMPNLLHRIFSTLVASLCVSFYLLDLGASQVVTSMLAIPLVWLCLNEFRYQSKYSLISGLVYGLSLSILFLQLADVFVSSQALGIYKDVRPWSISPWDSRLLYVIAMFYSVWKLLQVVPLNQHDKWFRLVFAVTGIFTLLSLNAQGIGLGIVMLMLGFARSNRILITLGILALMLYCSAYYYQMQETLLVKSAILMAIAIFAFICRWLLNHFAPASRER